MLPVCCLLLSPRNLNSRCPADWEPPGFFHFCSPLVLHRKLRCPPKNGTISVGKDILRPLIFREHVRFQGSIQMRHQFKFADLSVTFIFCNVKRQSSIVTSAPTCSRKMRSWHHSSWTLAAASCVSSTGTGISGGSSMGPPGGLENSPRLVPGGDGLQGIEIWQSDKLVQRQRWMLVDFNTFYHDFVSLLACVFSSESQKTKPRTGDAKQPGPHVETCSWLSTDYTSE